MAVIRDMIRTDSASDRSRTIGNTSCNEPTEVLPPTKSNNDRLVNLQLPIVIAYLPEVDQLMLIANLRARHKNICPMTCQPVHALKLLMIQW